MFKWTSKREAASNKDREELGRLNREYTDCIARDFLPAFLEGKDVRVENFCVETRQKMFDIDRKVYHNDHF